MIDGTTFSSVSVEKVNTESMLPEDLIEEMDSAILLYANALQFINNTRYLSPTKPWGSNANRATVVIPTSKALAEAPIDQNDYSGQYTCICIPTDVAKKIKVRMTNPDYYYGVQVWWGYGSSTAYDSGWVQGGNEVVFDIESYFASQSLSVPALLWIASNFKIGSAGNTPFSNETFKSLGYSIELL